MGTLLNPPRGSIRPEIQAAQTSIHRIVQTLRGPELKQKNIQLVINIYDGAVSNAFMGNTDSFLKAFPEASRRPMRLLLGYKDDGTVIYELALTTQVLSLYRSEDEIAFVIAHELAHLFEGHVEAIDESAEKQLKEVPRKWWSAQQYEVVADYEAMQAMLGKYELTAAKTALDQLLFVESESNYSNYISGLMDHHHEGVRLALVEAAIERMRSKDPLAKVRALTPLPQSLRIAAASNPEPRSPRFEEQKTSILRNVSERFLKGRKADFTSEERGILTKLHIPVYESQILEIKHKEGELQRNKRNGKTKEQRRKTKQKINLIS
ncbi:MAG: hypothetical protein EOP09_18760, partial [Proteobacteria bacterium]